MSVRDLLVLVLGLPLAVIGGAMALGLTIPVPVWGRDYVLTFPLVSQTSDLDLPTIYGPEDETRPLVVIDAGHGGRDPGSVGPGIQERTLCSRLLCGCAIC